MFRKPKNRGQRQRVRQDSDEGLASSPPSTVEAPPKPLLSFGDDEGVDTKEFKVKKQEARKRREKLARKAEEKTEIQTQKTDYGNVKFTNSDSLPVFKVPEKELTEEEEIVIYEEEEFNQDRETRGKFPTSYQDIPDAHAVYEARKKREQMRKGLVQSTENDDGFIALSGQKEVERERKTGSGSDEEDDDHGRFYSSKNELLEEEKKRRELHFEFLNREHGDDDDVNAASGSEDEEVLRWEREQISKGVRKQQMIDVRQEWLATTGRDLREKDETEVMEVDAIVRAPPKIFEPAEFIPIPIEQVVSDLRLKLKDEQSFLAGTEEDYAKVKSNIDENNEIIAKLPLAQRKAEEKYQMLQEMKEFTKNLIECFDEKVPMICELEDRLFQMWRERKERLMQRRRQDLKDEYEACSSAAAGNTASVKTGEYAARAAERESRRARRRLQRERTHQNASHNEGFSSDDEETNSQNAMYKDTTDTILRQTDDVFVDVLDEFTDICRICNNFVKWLVIDEESYTNAYIGLCIPKLLNPLIRHELMGWNPLVDAERSFSSMQWYKRLLAVGTEGSGVDLSHEEIVKLIPTVVQKCILPRLTRLVKGCFDPLSLQHSQNLAKVISQCINDYPTVTASAKEVKILLKAIHGAFKESISEDVFIPIFMKNALENSSTGCAAFLNRQFWTAVKAIECITQFSAIFSQEVMQALIVDGVVNRYLNLALQCIWPYSSEADNALKCRTIIKLLPNEWFPAANPTAFRSLSALFSAIAREYSENRSFSAELKKFICDIGRAD